MMEERIRVIAYAGYRADETPRAFFFNESRIDVVKVLDQWQEQEAANWQRRRYFKVKGSDSRAHLICYDEQEMSWYHCN
ncbi:hypothetical protein [Geobacter sp. DSM 9736]|uniref:hypothetical protein n=1 Tax=Geobacter sp. DSM 9736 TaxID=1277350 RepID=UPI000B512341|nr:hypothetical protein [Geobacter sp. DSM 9736]SNB47863.1 hypothetical protein SAMN06269301_3357 [Geobacter sp. DSM 9736]